MRKRTIIALFFVFAGLTSYAQLVELVVMNGPEFCAGTNRANTAHICVLPALPIPLASNSDVSYTWIVRHPQGAQAYYGSVPERSILLPWIGTYEIRVIIHYHNNGKSRPFASFVSPKLRIRVNSCE